VDALRRLAAAHREIEALFERVLAAEAGPARALAYRALKQALERHAHDEESAFYAAMRTTCDVAAQELVSLALDEHEDVRLLLAEIDAIDPATDAFVARCEMLAAEVARHVAMEEEDLFPRAQRLLGSDRLAAVAERLEAASKRPVTTARLRRPA
jgi:hemerythrin-like domain-containing protein